MALQITVTNTGNPSDNLFEIVGDNVDEILAAKAKLLGSKVEVETAATGTTNAPSSKSSSKKAEKKEEKPKGRFKHGTRFPGTKEGAKGFDAAAIAQSYVDNGEFFVKNKEDIPGASFIGTYNENSDMFKVEAKDEATAEKFKTFCLSKLAPDTFEDEDESDPDDEEADLASQAAEDKELAEDEAAEYPVIESAEDFVNQARAIVKQVRAELGDEEAKKQMNAILARSECSAISKVPAEKYGEVIYNLSTLVNND